MLLGVKYIIDTNPCKLKMSNKEYNIDVCWKLINKNMQFYM